MAYYDEGHVGGYWGRAGSGMLFSTGPKMLLLERAPWVMQGGTWGIPGGAIPVSEATGRLMDPYRSAKREAREEIGRVPRHTLMDRYVYRDGSFKFTTYIALVDSEFVPKLNDESTGYVWWDPDKSPRLPLHFGVRELLANWRR